MLSVRLLLSISLFSACLSALVIAEPSYEKKEADKEALADLEAFQRLLDQVDPPALHAALHDYSPKKFQHGIFKEDQTAIEAVHRDDASLATSIALLARRQDGGNNTTVVIVTSATETETVIPPTVTQSINPSTVPPNPVEPSTRITVPATPSAQPGTSVPASSVVVVTQTSGEVVTTTIAPASSAPVPSFTLGPGPVSLPSFLTAGQVVTTTNAGVVMTATLSSGSVITTTNAAGVIIVSTIDGGVVTLAGPSGSPNSPSAGSTAASRSASAAPQPSQTSIVLHTTTLANGAQSTITTAVVIQASNTEAITPTGSAGAAVGTGSSTATPGLQTGLAPRSRGWGWEVVGVLGGAVGVAMVL